jgi:hypothetical protein
MALGTVWIIKLKSSVEDEFQIKTLLHILENKAAFQIHHLCSSKIFTTMSNLFC